MIAGVGALGWIVGALAIGLWIGERGRRQAAERREVSGSPLGPTAARLPDQPDAEQRVLSAGRAIADHRFSEATIQKGAAQIKTEAEAVGRTISDKDAREQALMMLLGTADPEPDLPEFG